MRVIDVDNSINSGQVFLWKKIGDDARWYGVNGRDVLCVDDTGRIKSYRGKDTKTDFFRSKDNLDEIIQSISRDATTRKAVKVYPGLRILDQDPFQCLISFIISSNSNIQKIKSSLEKISKKFGTRVKFDGQEFFLFPKPGKLADAGIGEIRDCGVGYRAEFVKSAAGAVQAKEINFGHLRRVSYQSAKEEICRIPGVGNKVADCVLLFSLNKLESFPLDRWMIRILQKYYSDRFQMDTKTITDKQYEMLHEKITGYFGPYAGYAQQFLFKMEREKHQKKWL